MTRIDGVANSSESVILTRLSTLSEDIGEMRGAMKELAESVAKLALIEERQTQANEALARAFKQIDKIGQKIEVIESRVAVIERELPMQKQASSWVVAAVWAAAGLAVMFVVKKAGLI